MHLGWEFCAVEQNLRPRSFFGLTQRNIVSGDMAVEMDAALLLADQPVEPVSDNSLESSEDEEMWESANEGSDQEMESY